MKEPKTPATSYTSFPSGKSLGGALKITVYAILKEHFAKEFSLQEPFETIAQLKNHLIAKNPNAAGILNISRFAVNNEFVQDDYRLIENDNISIMPPSSGG